MRVATDGSCLKNPGGATGWAWVAEDGRWRSGSVAEGSNNIGELMAAIGALKAHQSTPELHLEIDSQYVLNIIQKWGPAWKRKGWKKANGEPVANARLVARLLQLADRPGLTLEWVRGHNGHFLNELADQQAGNAARSQLGLLQGRYTLEELADAMLEQAKTEERKRQRQASRKGQASRKARATSK